MNDPENFQEIISSLHSLTSREDVVKLINTNFPNWLVDEIKSYSSDYPHLQRNWEAICKMSGTSPQSIILVSDVAFRGDTEHTTISEFCEYMTKKGYVVRRVGEFIKCEVCYSAIPCIEIWHLMKEKKMPVPAEWRNVCTGCLKNKRC